MPTLQFCVFIYVYQLSLLRLKKENKESITWFRIAAIISSSKFFRHTYSFTDSS
jgi:hypothetical protein